MLKKFARLLLIAAAGVVGLVCTLYLAIVLINLGDGPPDAAAERLVEMRKPTLPAADNGFYILAGFGAPDGADAQALGEQHMAALLKVFADHPSGNASAEAYNETAPYSRPVEALPAKLRCSPDKQSCLALYLKEREAYGTAARDKAFLLKRYADMRAKPGYEEVLIPDFSAPFTSFSTLRGAHEIELALAAQAVADGAAQAGLQRLAAIAAHDRLLLTRAQTLVGRMIGVRMVFDSAHLASELVRRDAALAGQHRAVLQGIMAPLEPGVFDMGAVFETEAGMMMRLFAGLDRNLLVQAEMLTGSRVASTLGMPMYRRNDSMRAYHAIVQAQLAMAKAAPRELEGQIEKLRQTQQQAVDQVSMTNLAMLRNPVGKVLLAEGMPEQSGYKLRLVDLDGYLRLFGLQLALTGNSVAPAERAAWIRQHAPDALSPYDGSPLTYDAAKEELRFIGKGRNNYLPGDKKTLAIALGS